MSYDLTIYFPHTEFPHQEWEEILLLFDAEKKDQRDCPDCCDWTIDTQTVVWITLYPVNRNPDATYHFSSVGTRWRVSISTNGGGRTARSVWTQFAVAYYALSFIPGVTVDNNNGTLFTEHEAFQEFAGHIMPRLAAYKSNFVKQNLMTPEGIPVF